MNNAVTDNQTRDLAIKFLQLFSDLLNSILQDFNAKADVTEMKTYIKTIEKSGNDLIFKDGNGNTVYELPVLKSDPLLSLSSNTLSLAVNSSSDVTVSRLGDGLISAAFIDGTDCALVSVSDTTITFTATSAGSGSYQVNVAESSNYTAASDTVIVTVEETMSTDWFSFYLNKPTVTVNAGATDNTATYTLNVNNDKLESVDVSSNIGWVSVNTDTKKITITAPSQPGNYQATLTATGHYHEQTATKSATLNIDVQATAPTPSPKPDDAN